MYRNVWIWQIEPFEPDLPCSYYERLRTEIESNGVNSTMVRDMGGGRYRSLESGWHLIAARSMGYTWSEYTSGHTSNNMYHYIWIWQIEPYEAEQPHEWLKAEFTSRSLDHITVQEVGDGRYRLLDSKWYVLAARSMGIYSIPVYISYE